MIREHRSRAKLEAYYEKFARDGVLDPNVHPWVADSWQQSKKKWCWFGKNGYPSFAVQGRIP